MKSAPGVDLIQVEQLHKDGSIHFGSKAMHAQLLHPKKLLKSKGNTLRHILYF